MKISSNRALRLDIQGNLGELQTATFELFYNEAANDGKEFGKLLVRNCSASFFEAMMKELIQVKKRVKK